MREGRTLSPPLPPTLSLPLSPISLSVILSLTRPSPALPPLDLLGEAIIIITTAAAAAAAAAAATAMIIIIVDQAALGLGPGQSVYGGVELYTTTTTGTATTTRNAGAGAVGVRDGEHTPGGGGGG
jgi:hypothetical protein